MTAGGDITYTKAVLYGQDISHLTREQLESLTSIGNPLVTVPLGISDKNDNDNGTTVILEATFQNSNLKADLPYTAVGFFAKRGDDAEKLIAVGVATEGAYLAATSPDGVATDALDIKVAIAIGDSANVTAMIDPAGSVTPAALHNVITDVKSEMKTGLDTKADKSTVDSDVKSINDTLAAKADKQTVTDDLVKKADKTDVDAQIGTVNKSVSDLSDTVKANKDDADKTLATKADKATVESDLATKANQSDLDKTNAEVAKKANSDDVKAQIDGVSKSISDVSDTVKANKDATDQALATKADKTDVAKDIDTVNKSISSMSATITANQKATDTALDTKADKTTVNQELATKANSSDVDKKLDEKADKSSVDAKINAIDFSKIKFRKQYLTKSGIPSDKTWNATKNSDGSYTIDIYQDDWTAYKVASLLQAITTKADQSSLDATNKTVATKANSSDVYTKKQVDDAFSSRDATIATKADKATVDAEISKIDFTPYAKTADVNKEIKTVTDLANSKVDANYSYSKAELDKKLLALSTDTSGKVNADQVSQMIADKADKADVTKQIKTVTDLANSKVDATYSYSKAELDKKLLAVTTTADGKVGADQVAQMIAGKANKDAVDKQIKAVTDSVATKANSDDVYSKTEANNLITDAKNTGKQAQATADSALAGYNKRPVISGGASDDLLSFKTTQLRYYPGNGNTCKNLPPATNQQWFTVEYIFENPNGDGIAIYRSPANEIWTIGNNGGYYDQAWVKVANANDIQGLQNQVNTKLASGDLPTELQKITFRKQYVNSDGQTADKTWSATKNKDGTYTIDLWQDDWTASKLSGVLAQLPNKADTSTVNAQIADAKNTGKQAQATADSALAGYNKRPVISGGASDDLLSFKTTQLRYYPGNGNTCKNLPPATNQQWFTVEYIFENPNGDGIAIYRSPANEIWTIGNNGGYYDQAWVKVANANDIQGLQNQVNTKLASGDLPTELQKITFRKQYVDGSNKLQDGHWKLVKQADGSYLVDLYHDDWTAQRVAYLLNQIGSKADTATVNSQVADAKNAATKAQTTADNANNNANGRLSLNGGTMGSTAQISFADSGTWGTSNKPAGKRGGLRWDGQSDSAEIYADEDGSDNLDLVFQIGDDGSNHFSFRNQVGAEVAAIQSNGHYTGTIDWASVNGRPDVATHADVNNKVNVQGDLFRLATAGNTWVDILGVANSYTPVLVSIRDQGSGNLLGNYAAAIAFGGGDTKGVLNVAYSDHTARIIGGNGNAPVWHEDIAWKSDIDRLQSIINQQNQTIQSLTTRLTNVENEIRYIKANYVEGRTFPASQEAQANSWENENPQRIAFITK